MTITALVIADRPPHIPVADVLATNQIDLIITLGDLEYTQIAELGMIHTVPKIGIYGNHCTPGYLEQLGILDLHLQTTVINGITFGGFEGSPRYKNDPYAKMYTEEEAARLLKEFPAVDVFISHSPPRGINDEDDVAHQGFIALRDYIDTHQPTYFLHGHTYPTAEQLVTQYQETHIVYVSAEKIVDLVF